MDKITTDNTLNYKLRANKQTYFSPEDEVIYCEMSAREP